MPRNYEYEELVRNLWLTLTAAAVESLPDEPMGVETPMQRAERAFAAEDIVSAYLAEVQETIAAELLSHVDNAPKGRKAGLKWAADLLVGANT